jgi:hypothetical protein
MVVATARCMMKAKGLPAHFWGEAVNTTIYLLNRSPSRSVEGMTPYEAWHGKKPSVEHLRTFGSLVYVKNTKPNLKKLDDHSSKMIFVGYKKGSKAYRAYDSRTGRVHVTRDVVFDDLAQWDWSRDGGGDDDSETFEFVVTTTTTTVQAEPDQNDYSVSPQVADRAPTPPLPQEPVEHASPPNTAPDVDIDHDEEAPLRFRRIDNVLGPAKVPGMAERLLHEELYSVSAEEPATLEEVVGDPSWRAAMIEELRAIEENHTWEVIDLPVGHRPIGLKWVYKAKKDESGCVVKHKAHLVARGFVQKQGIDFEEVFAPVARMESVRLILAVAAHEGWKVHHMDVKSAFLNGELAEEVHVRQPPGFALGDADQVLHLKKALYGLRQAPRAWYEKLHSSLNDLGFTRSNHEYVIYTWRTTSRPLVVGVYVDDLLIAGAIDSDIKQFKQEMQDRFRMSDLGLLTYYLGIEVSQDSSGISLCQKVYATRLLERTGMTDCNPSRSPMETRLKLTKASEEAKVNAIEYRSVVGALRYLIHTRPDLAHAVSYVSRFMSEPHGDDLAAVTRILRYIAGTQGHGIWYARGVAGDLLVQGYSDSDHGGDEEDSRSISGVLFYLGSNPVTWQSQKQKSMALSSCEAEYVASSVAACQAIWLSSLLSEILGEEGRAPLLKIDNKAAIDLVKNPVHHGRSKHIHIRYHFVRECATEGRIEIQFVGTNDQLADILTKPLSCIRFMELKERIGVVEIK